jgi:nucleotide-binding universal stress UspA family protein
MKVLVALDDSSCSAATISAVIDQFRPDTTDVRVLHVIEWLLERPTALAFADGSAAVARVLVADHEIRGQTWSLVGQAVRRLHAAGFRATTHVIEGHARTAIVTMADDWPSDIIVMGSHGRTGFQRVLMGSVSEWVVRHAKCTVQVVREHQRATAVDQVAS